jgi:hypothetical protein
VPAQATSASIFLMLKSGRHVDQRSKPSKNSKNTDIPQKFFPLKQSFEEKKMYLYSFFFFAINDTQGYIMDFSIWMERGHWGTG